MFQATTTSRAATAVVRRNANANRVVLVQRRIFSSLGNNNTTTRTISSTAKTKNIAILSNPSLANGTASKTKRSSFFPLEIALNSTTKAALPWIGNLSYLALASGFLMTDMLDLRVLLVGGYTGLVAFHSLHEKPLRIPLRWSAVFVCVNAAAAGFLLMDRYATVSNEEEELYQAEFAKYMTRGQFQQLRQLATRKHIPAGTKLTSENVPCGSMYFILQGQAHVFLGPQEALLQENNVATIEQGGFVNDVAYQRVGAAGDIIGAYGTVVTTQDCDVLVWDIAALKRHMKSKPAMEQGMNYCMSDHLVKSLLRQRDARHEKTLQ